MIIEIIEIVFYSDLYRTQTSEQNQFQYNPWNAEQGFRNKTLSENPYSFPRPFLGEFNKQLFWFCYTTRVVTVNSVKSSTDNGLLYGLILLLNANTKERYCSIESNTGFLVQVHQPNIQPSPLFLGELARNSHETRISITASLDKATPGVKGLPRKVRNCLYQDEQPLEFFGLEQFHTSPISFWKMQFILISII